MLRDNYLIDSTGKYDDMGDRLYFRMAFRNAGALIRAARETRKNMTDSSMRCFMTIMTGTESLRKGQG